MSVWYGPGWSQPVHGLLEQARHIARLRRPGAAHGQHIGRDVAAVDVHTRAQVRQQQATGAAADIEHRLTEPSDKVLEIRELRTVEVEFGPPLCYQAVMPGLWGFSHRTQV